MDVKGLCQLDSVAPDTMALWNQMLWKEEEGASPDGLAVKVPHSHPFGGPGWVTGAEPHDSSVSSQAVAAAHIEGLEGLTSGIYNCVLGLWEEKKEDWQQMVGQGKSFPAKKKRKKESKKEKEEERAEKRGIKISVLTVFQEAGRGGFKTAPASVDICAFIPQTFHRRLARPRH